MMVTDRTRMPFDEAAEAREMEAFFRQQDPVALAAVDWHTRREQGLSAEELAAFEQWREASPRHAAAFARLERGVSDLRSLPASEAERLRGRQAAGPPATTASTSPHSAARPHPRPRRSWLRPGPAWAALGCLLLLTAGIVWQTWLPQRAFTGHYVVERGQRQAITLPDGSELTLDAQTDARVTLYAHHRELRLDEGQVLLSVAPDPDKPFQVLAGPARVTVLGTRFSVRYRHTGSQDGTVDVAVEQGRVRVADARPSRPDNVPAAVELAAGQGLTVSADGGLGQTRAVAAGSVAPWLKGLVRFDNTPLGVALQELEHYGPTGLVIRDPAVAALPIGGSFAIGQPQDFARMAAQILPIELVRRASGQTEIVKKIR